MDPGAKLLEEARKKERASGGFFSKVFGSGGSSHLEEAAELYVSAANKYKASKSTLGEAAKAFAEAARVHEMRGPDGKHEAASQLVEAAKMFRKAEPADIPTAISCLDRAVHIFVELGRFQMAAKNMKEIAELYEGDNKISDAIAAYTQAADWFDGEDSKSTATTCRLKVAHFLAQTEKYLEAHIIFEQIALSSVDNNLTRWSVKEYLFKATLCLLANKDNIGAQNALKKFQNVDATFESTNEFKFLSNLTQAIEGSDIEAFTNHVVQYDALKKLDNWTTTMLLRVKRTLNEEPSLA